MPPATDKADPWGQFLNTFMFLTEGKSHLFLLEATSYIYTADRKTPLFLTTRDVGRA